MLSITKLLNICFQNPILQGSLQGGLLFQEYEFTIKDWPRKKHGNVDALLWTYKRVGDHSKDDDFPNAKLFAFDVEKALKEANYLLD